jgi:hypothetical protein
MIEYGAHYKNYKNNSSIHTKMNNSLKKFSRTRLGVKTRQNCNDVGQVFPSPPAAVSSFVLLLFFFLFSMLPIDANFILLHLTRVDGYQNASPRKLFQLMRENAKLSTFHQVARFIRKKFR